MKKLIKTTGVKTLSKHQQQSVKGGKLTPLTCNSPISFCGPPGENECPDGYYCIGIQCCLIP